jgi:hypothetical protein
MKRWIAALTAALLLPACGDGTTADVDGRNPTIPADLGSGQPPVVRIVSPAPRATFQEGGTVTIQALAVDPNAVLARVNFYDGDRLIGGKSAAPFLLAYGGLTAGTHILTAVAIDIEGITSVSPPVTIFVVQRGGDDDEDEDPTDIFVDPSRR